MDEWLHRAPVGLVKVATDGTVVDVNEAAESLLQPADDPTGAPLSETFPRSVEDSLLVAFDGDSVTETAFEEYYPDLERWLSVSVVPTDDDIAVYVQNITARRRGQQSVERLQKERDRTAVIDRVQSELLGELVTASSRAEIAETLCRGLGETELYEFAWVGARDIGGDELTVQAVAGDTGQIATAIRDAVADDTVTTIEEHAVTDGQLRTAQPLAESERVPEAVRIAGFAAGVQSALAIPLVYGSSVHGVVGVYAGGTEAFSDRERTSFETLGEVAGFGVTAARNRNLLLSDSIAEITFEVGDSSVLAKLSRLVDSELTLGGLVPSGDDELLCFVSVRDYDVQTTDAVISGVDGVEEARVIDASGRGGTLELRLTGSTPLLAVSSLGGTVRRGTFDRGAGEIVVDLPPDGDVRRIVATVRNEYDAEFAAKTERERTVTTAREFRDQLDDRLTDRQRTALQTAYLADYFESPRGSTAAEVASALDISDSTLLYHLRAGQRKLLDAYLVEDGVRE